MQRILVPTDFSKESKEAFKVAIQLASKTKGEIVLLNILTIPNLSSTGFAGETLPFDPAYFTEVIDDIKKELLKIKEMNKEKSIKVNIEAVYGDFVITIKNMIEKHKIDLVVMGTSGASGIAEIFIGSNTEKVVRFSPVPVLAVREAIDIKSIRNILLPSTLLFNQIHFIRKLKELQLFFNATLHILLINTPLHFMRDADAHESLEEFAIHYKLTNYKLHFRNYLHEEDGILSFANTEGMDLVAMGTHARKGLAHFFNISITENVVNHIKIPIWTYSLKES
ncbi:universal stress protein [Chryseotalea sanaruensis]|uniref:Universal stress protein n=1 Tax=Chryseotalea sanaruensis TaxID=2482724 RepID=A0A401U609_9BACT|nr:universal stress protein [Chryseotalea sanaruensis]GCC50394.1 universal stress protein [Chryseotalea sanaruensis]